MVYTDEEARQRLEAALRGARAVGHKPMKSVPKKKPALVGGLPKVKSQRKS
jgi:hypothetical protein